MTDLQILFRINEMTGNTITLYQSLVVMGRVVFAVEVLEEEEKEYNMDQLIRDIIDEVISDQEFSCK